MKLKTKESDVLKACLEYLAYRKGYFWRNNSGAMPMGERFVRFGHKGSSDILGILPMGRMVCVECKATSGVQSHSQKVFQYEIEKWGGLYCLAYSVDDLIKAGI